MRPGREIDARIAKEVFGHKVWAQNKVLFEAAPKGDRPLRNYSKEMQWAQDIVTAMHITLIPIEGGEWFVFVGPEHQEGWQSPQAVLEFLSTGPFDTCGASSGSDLPALICEAALKAVEKRAAQKVVPNVAPEASHNESLHASDSAHASHSSHAGMTEMSADEFDEGAPPILHS